MRAKQCHKPPMTGNGKFIPPIKMVILVMTGGWCKWHCCGHSNGISGDGELLLAGAVCKKRGRTIEISSMIFIMSEKNHHQLRVSFTQIFRNTFLHHHQAARLSWHFATSAHIQGPNAAVR